MKTFGALAVLMFTGMCAAADESPWPRFRGPNGSGVAEGQKPPFEIGPDKNVKWKIAVPSGLSSPIIAGENLVITAFENDKLYTIAYRRDDGQEAWRKEAPAEQIEKFLPNEGSPAASTPVTDGERIVSYFGSYGLVAYDLSGKELWKFPIPASGVPGGFGTGASPTLVDGHVIIVRDEMKDARIIAVDVATGSRKWEQPRVSPASYCTPVAWKTASGTQIVAAGHARMAGYDLKDGKEKWTVVGLPSGCCASPVTADGLLLFAGWSPGGADDTEFQMPTFDAQLQQLDKDADGAISKAEGEQAFQGFFDSQDSNGDGTLAREEYDVVLKFMSEGKNCAFALKPGGTGDVTESHVLWTQTKGLPYVSSAIVYGGQYVMVKDGGIVTAYDAKTGKQAYMNRSAAEGSYYASPVAANGHIYFTSLTEGVVTVIKAGSDKAEVVAQNPPLGERVSATPAIADDTLYIRTDKHLYAFKSE
jgi:outer membrane protein assembly factor BamB